MNEDAELLQQYTRTGSEKAFTDLVGRHLRLVYFTALRGTAGDRALAEEVAQGVFTLLARKTAALGDHAALAGWLYTTTRHLVSRTIRNERTRRRNEQAIAMQEAMTTETGARLGKAAAGDR